MRQSGFGSLDDISSEEGGGGSGLRSGKEVRGGRRLVHRAMEKEDDRIRKAGGLPHVVGGEDDAGAARDGLRNDRLDLARRPAVEARGRLVEEEELGAGDQRAGERQLLRLAARKCRRLPPDVVAEADPCRPLAAAAPAASRRRMPARRSG